MLPARSAGGWDFAAGIVLLGALLACSTRTDQIVNRYHLSLESPYADAGAACWDACLPEPNGSLRSACLRSCPGVEVTPHEACQYDGREPARELCHTHVFSATTPEKEDVQRAADLTGRLVTEGLALTAEAATQAASRKLRRRATSSAPPQPAESAALPSPPPNLERRPADPTPEPAKPRSPPKLEHRVADPIVRPAHRPSETP
jgi:hypothetical protein